MEQLPNSDIEDLEDEYAYEDDYLVKAIIGVVVDQKWLLYLFFKR